MDAVVATTEKLPMLIAHLRSGDQPSLERLARETSILEGEADALKNLVRDEMPHGVRLPFDRRDILRTVSEIDAIADCAEDVGVLLTIRPLEVPETMDPVLERFAQQVMDTVSATSELVKLLPGLVDSGFSRSGSERAKEQIDLISAREHEADKLQDQCAKALFAAEDQMQPVAVFMWTKVLNKIGDVANHAENVGDQFRLFLAR